MVGVSVGENSEDFIARLHRLLNEGEENKVFKEIIQLNTPVEQLSTLEQLVPQLEDNWVLRLELIMAISFSRALALALALAHDRTHELARDRTLARDLAIARDLARDLDRVRNLDRILDFTFDLHRAHDLVLALDSTLTREGSLDHDLALALALARDLALAPARPRLAVNRALIYRIEQMGLIANSLVYLFSVAYIPSDVVKQIRLNYERSLANAYEENLYLAAQQSSPVLHTIGEVLKHIIGADLRYITLEGLDHITPDVLLYDIAPYLKALANIHQVHAKLTKNKKKYREPRIVQIHNESAKIEITSLGDVIRALNDVFSIRKRKQDAKWRDVEIEKSELQKQKTQAELEAHVASIAIEQDPAISIAEREIKLQIQREELKQKQLETREKELALAERSWELEQAQMIFYFEKTIELLNRLSPEPLTPEQLAEHLPITLNAVKVMMQSRLTMRIGWHERPRTLPEQDKKK
jgi:hypothetical protein